MPKDSAQGFLDLFKLAAAAFTSMYFRQPVGLRLLNASGEQTSQTPVYGLNIMTNGTLAAGKDRYGRIFVDKRTEPEKVVELLVEGQKLVLKFTLPSPLCDEKFVEEVPKGTLLEKICKAIGHTGPVFQQLGATVTLADTTHPVAPKELIAELAYIVGATVVTPTPVSSSRALVDKKRASRLQFWKDRYNHFHKQKVGKQTTLALKRLGRS